MISRPAYYADSYLLTGVAKGILRYLVFMACETFLCALWHAGHLRKSWWHARHFYNLLWHASHFKRFWWHRRRLPYINSDNLAYHRENPPFGLQFKVEPLPVLQLIHYEAYHFPLPRSKLPTPGTSTVAKGLTDRLPAAIPSTQLASTSETPLANKTPKPTTGPTQYPERAELTCPPSQSLRPTGKEKEGYREGESGNSYESGKTKEEQPNTIIIPHKIHDTPCELCPSKTTVQTDPEQPPLEPGDTSERQEIWATLNLPEPEPPEEKFPREPGKEEDGCKKGEGRNIHRYKQRATNDQKKSIVISDKNCEQLCEMCSPKTAPITGNSTLTPQMETDFTAPKSRTTTPNLEPGLAMKTENKEDGNETENEQGENDSIAQVITVKTDNITSPDNLAVTLPISGAHRTTDHDPIPQSPDEAQPCSPDEHEPAKLRDGDDRWSLQGKSFGQRNRGRKSSRGVIARQLSELAPYYFCCNYVYNIAVDRNQLLLLFYKRYLNRDPLSKAALYKMILFRQDSFLIICNIFRLVLLNKPVFIELKKKKKDYATIH